MKKVNILNVEFDNMNKQETLELLHSKIKNRTKTFVVTANPEIVMHAVNHSDYMQTIRQADHIIADGAGIIIGSKIIKDPLPERVAGFDLMKELLALANKERLTVFFLGSQETVIKQAVENVKKEFSHLVIGGYHHGFFNKKDNHITQLVKEANADLVFVALGFPKQEFWIHKHLPEFDKGIFMGVGGSFDILAGNIKRAPAIWRKLNIEWVYRLIQQPSRWKRMMAIPLFLKKIWQFRRKQAKK